MGTSKLGWWVVQNSLGAVSVPAPVWEFVRGVTNPGESGAGQCVHCYCSTYAYTNG